MISTSPRSHAPLIPMAMSETLPRKIVIGMPTSGSNVQVQTLASLVGVCRELGNRGLPFAFLNVDRCEIVAARNRIAWGFLADPEASHLLFVDADMQFGVDALRRLLDSGQPLVGCAYSRREVDLAAVEATWKASQESGRPLSLDHAVRVAAPYVFRPTEAMDAGESPRIVNGLIRVRGVGMGVTLIAREVFETLAESGEVPVRGLGWEAEPDETGTFGFFDPIEGEEGFRLSEDYSFCERWIRFGQGEVWCNIEDPIGHFGSHGFQGRFLESLMSAPRD